MVSDYSCDLVSTRTTLDLSVVIIISRVLLKALWRTGALWGRLQEVRAEGHVLVVAGIQSINLSLSLSVYVHLHIYIYISRHIHVYMYTYASLSLYIYVYLCGYTTTNTHTKTQTRAAQERLRRHRAPGRVWALAVVSHGVVGLCDANTVGSSILAAMGVSKNQGPEYGPQLAGTLACKDTHN